MLLKGVCSCLRSFFVVIENLIVCRSCSSREMTSWQTWYYITNILWYPCVLSFVLFADTYITLLCSDEQSYNFDCSVMILSFNISSIFLKKGLILMTCYFQYSVSWGDLIELCMLWCSGIHFTEWTVRHFTIPYT